MINQRMIGAMLFATAAAKNFNILSLDSARYAGLITADFLAYMERRAYFIGQNNQCYEKNGEQRIPLYELFDFIAGSESGAIIASSISTPLKNDPTKSNWVTRVEEFYKKHGDDLYTNARMLVGVKVVFGILFLLIFGFLGYKLAEWYFQSKVKEDHMAELHDLIKQQKRIKKNTEKDVGSVIKKREELEK